MFGGIKRAIGRGATNAQEVAAAGKAQDSVRYAEQGLKNARTPMNMGRNGILSAPVPEMPTAMTDRQLAGLRVVSQRIAHEAQNSKEGYRHLRDISKNLTMIKTEHDQTVAQQAKDTCTQARSQHQVAAVFEELRPEYMLMNQKVTSLRDQNEYAMQAIQNYDSYVTELIGAA